MPVPSGPVVISTPFQTVLRGGRERFAVRSFDVLQLEAEAREVELNVLGEGRVPPPIG